MSEFPYPAFADLGATILFQDGSIRIEKQEYICLTLMTGISFCRGLILLYLIFRSLLFKIN